MLVASDMANGLPVCAPDFSEEHELAELRERTRRDELTCPECKALLNFRAGELRIPHFAHRSRGDCPLASVSLERLLSRQLLYRFFCARIGPGKLSGPVELEPAMSNLPAKMRFDVLVRRGDKAPVAVMLVETGVKSEIRRALSMCEDREGYVFRPVFLASRLKPTLVDCETFYQLDTTQRDWRYETRYGSQAVGWSQPTLHFIDPSPSEWRSLRGLRLEHAPGTFFAKSVRVSPISEILWSEGQSDWTHPGEILARLPPYPQNRIPRPW